MTKLIIQPITTESYRALIKGAEVLEKDSTAPKVLKLVDGSFFKLFRRKRWFSSELIYPYVKRFADNASMLNKIGIKTPKITALYRFFVNSIKFTAVRYIPLEGETLRHALKESNAKQQEALVVQFAVLVAKLHQHGVYFRSIHLANVLVMANGELGLIDFADMSKQSSPLSKSKRLRNLKHLKRYQEDVNWIFSEYFTSFLTAYETIAGTKASKFLYAQ